MKFFMTRLNIMIKRTLKQPVYLLMLLSLPVLTIVYVNIPEKEKSAYIPVAVFCADESLSSDTFKEKLNSLNSVFTFYLTDSKDSLYKELASGNTSYGYYIPEGFFDAYNSGMDAPLINIYLNGSSTLTPVINEIIYSCIFNIYAIEILKVQLADSLLFDESLLPSVYEDADTFFQSYMNSDNIFKLEDYSNGSYNEIVQNYKLEIPVAKLTGLFIFVASLILAGSYITNAENGAYYAADRKTQLNFRIIEIMSGVIPITVTGMICLFIIHENSILYTALHTIIYSVAVILFAFLVSFIFKKSTSFYRVLPVFLILTVIFSGTFFDLSDYSQSFRIIGRLFLPYYF